jgi:protein-L-isoaspartate(D-aspartate) O-methyltransferase
MLHASAQLDYKAGETAIHIGAGTGYYTAVLSNLVRPTGRVIAYEIDTEIASRATANLASIPSITVSARSGAQAPLPICDLCYVSAGATMPLELWRDALRPGGRLLFPLTPDGPDRSPGAGGMLLITRTATEKFNARFIMPVMFIPCVGARDEDIARRSAIAFQTGDMSRVCSLHCDNLPDDTC